MGKKDTMQEGSGAPIPALYKIALLLSVSLVCVHISFEKKKCSSDKKNGCGTMNLLHAPPFI